MARAGNARTRGRPRDRGRRRRRSRRAADPLDGRGIVHRAPRVLCADGAAQPVRGRPQPQSRCADHRDQGLHAPVDRPDESRQLHSVVVPARRRPRAGRRPFSRRARIGLPTEAASAAKVGARGPHMKTVLLAAVFAVLAIPGALDARVWTVGRGSTDFPLIAPAIAHAQDGDEIRIGPGAYREDLVIAKRLSLVGEGRPVLFGTGRGTVIDVRADGCTISGLIIDGTGVGAGNQMDAAVRLTSNNNTVTGNEMRRVFYGVVIAGGSGNVIADNTIEGLLDLPFGQRGDGIYVYQGPRNHILRNRIAGERDAIFLQYAHDVRVEDNSVERSRYGLHDMFSDNTIVRDNVFRTSLVGANVMNSKRLTLERNEFAHNRGVTAVGLTLKDCDGSSVSHNQFIGNARALQLDGSSSNRFAHNRFAQNDVAVRLLASAERNTFTSNEFVQNWSDVVESGRDS